MAYSSFHYFPLALPFLLVLAALFALTVALVAVRFLSFASESMGLGPRAMLTVMLLSLLGSYINIPIAYLPEREMMSVGEVPFFGVHYAVPILRHWPGTLLAVNVGGAVIPILLSVYLVAKNRLFGLSIAGIAVVAAVCHALARPVPGLGIAVPVFVPPLATAVVALLLSRRYAAPLAYVSGSVGTLVGADLLNLDKVQGLGTPIASIGGAGTFDGIFVTGLLAVLYASLISGRRLRSAARSG